MTVTGEDVVLNIQLERKHALVIERWFDEDVLGESMVGDYDRAKAMRAMARAVRNAEREAEAAAVQVPAKE